MKKILSKHSLMFLRMQWIRLIDHMI